MTPTHIFNGQNNFFLKKLKGDVFNQTHPFECSNHRLISLYPQFFKF